MDTVLELRKARKVYGTGNLMVEALKETNLKIERGIFYAIIGKSGSGKSTMLHILGTLDHCTTGEVICEGESIASMSEKELALFRRRKIGFIFQNYQLLEEHTVLENILMPLHLDGRKPDMPYMQSILDLLGLAEKTEYYPLELSGGQQQRVAIARALSTKPAILLADEPTGNLDEKNSAEVMELLQRTSKEFQQTSVMVTHDMQIAKMADQRILIRDGVVEVCEE